MRPKRPIIEADDRCEAELERISRGYEAIAEYIGKRMFEQGVYAARRLAEREP